MARRQIAILSDVHYACAAEQARGNDFEYRGLPNPLVRFLISNYRHFIWLREPVGQNARLDEFITAVGRPDWVVANGDYCCDCNSVGVSDDSSLQSARECLDKLREKFPTSLKATIGDHELGKLSFSGGRGGMRLASLKRARGELGLEPIWRVELGNYLLLGITSSLVALPLFEPDILPEERREWQQLSAEHLAAVREVFASLKPNQRVLLFLHDPSALPFLAQDEIVRGKMSQIEQTIIGHLHSNLVFRTSRVLSGMPTVHFMGPTAKRMTTALAKSRCWGPFKVRLCPSLAGVELLKDGGYYTVELDEAAREPAQFQFHRLKR